MRALAFYLGALALLGAGCGGKVELGTGGTGAGGGAGSGLCPLAEPLDDSCAGVADGMRCTYGDSVRPECRHVWACSNGFWKIGKLSCSPPVGDCDFMVPPAGQVCANQGDVCTLDSTICICSLCPGGPCMEPPAKWTCAGPPATTGCPAIVPNDGSSCPKLGLMCTYGIVCSGSGAQVTCTDKGWSWDTMVDCPL